jgi:hypothetical protein
VCRPYARGMAVSRHLLATCRAGGSGCWFTRASSLCSPSHLTTCQRRCVIRRYVPNMPAAATKAAGEELESLGRLYIAVGSNSAAGATLKPQVERAIAAYENLTARSMALVKMLNELET